MLQYCKRNDVTRIADSHGHCVMAERAYELAVAHSKQTFMLKRNYNPGQEASKSVGIARLGNTRVD